MAIVLLRRTRIPILLISLAFPGNDGLGQHSTTLPAVEVVTPADVAVWKSRGLGGPKAPFSPDDVWDAFQRQFDAMVGAGKRCVTVQDASLLVRGLYLDMQRPYLNSRWQDLVVDEIGLAAFSETVDDDALDVLRDGLLTYEAQGGGRSSPFTLMRLARSLAALGEPDRPELVSRFRATLDEARQFADQLKFQMYEDLIKQESPRIARIID